MSWLEPLFDETVMRQVHVVGH